MIPKAKAMLPPGGTFELPIGNADFIGFMDYLVPVGKGLKLDGLITGEDLDEFEAFDLYDFKYSNNAKNYAVSGQLHEYKYWYELTHPGHRIRNMYFLIVPKPKIRQKSTETLPQFRDRLQAALKDTEPALMPVQYNPMKIVDFLTDVKHMVEATDFPKNPNHFCGWCEYEEYCQKGWDYMLLPKNERRDLNATKKKVVWLYGAPFSGKTFFANQFPDPLMLNTDGNIKFVDAPYIAIRDTVTVEGRITKRRLAYEVFMDAVTELEKKQNDFRTIVVDLLEDVYESCRVYICDRQGWKHESDDSFRAWDMVRSEFLNTLKRLVNLDYENIILISHEDRSRDLTRKGGDKISSIKPNLQDKVANKVAGIILASHTQNLEEFADVDAPVITIDRTVSPRIPSASADNYYGGYIAAEHLIARGCRRLLYVSGSAHLDMDANKRYLGFQDACRRLSVDKPSAVDAAERQFVRMDYQETVAEIFRNHPDVDGILCSNDVIAAEIIQYCRRHEIDIPGRLKLIGYDDTRFASLCSPQLTTIHQPVEDICRYAVESILHASRGGVVPTCAVFPVTLVTRETT